MVWVFLGLGEAWVDVVTETSWRLPWGDAAGELLFERVGDVGRPFPARAMAAREEEIMLAGGSCLVDFVVVV